MHMFAGAVRSERVSVTKLSYKMRSEFYGQRKISVSTPSKIMARSANTDTAGLCDSGGYCFVWKLVFYALEPASPERKVSKEKTQV